MRRLASATAAVACACALGCGHAVAPTPRGASEPSRSARSVAAAEQPFTAGPPASAERLIAPPEVMPARYLRSLEHLPSGYSAGAPPGGRSFARPDNDLLLGDLLFHSPRTLGPRARELGVSCQSCHPNGAAHTTLFVEGASDRPGNVDLSSSVFRTAADDGVDNALNVPSLRGARFTPPYGRDGRIASLSEFIQHVVSVEFDGQPLDTRQLFALTRYVAELDFLPNARLDAHDRLGPDATGAARRGAVAFERPRQGFGGMSCASCHPPSTFFRDGRVHRLGGERPPSPHAIENGYETPTLLGLAETAPYFHDGRFATLAEVVDWFDATFGLQLRAGERGDLVAYLEAVGAVDRPRDDRPLARRLDEVFAYAALLTESTEREGWLAALEAILGELARAPAPVAARADELRARLTALWRAVDAGEPPSALVPRAAGLRSELARLAADWAGSLGEAISN